mgnify:CR=1 FL=1
MKKWYTSKTIWFNVITTILGLVAELSNTFPVSDHPKLWISIVAVGNIILRFLTTQSITSAPTE